MKSIEAHKIVNRTGIPVIPTQEKTKLRRA